MASVNMRYARALADAVFDLKMDSWLPCAI